MTVKEWQDEAVRLFGKDSDHWRFVCPVCKYEATVEDYRKAGASEDAIGFSCVGRWSGGRDAFGEKGPGPCNYAGGGLFRLNPVKIVDEQGKEHDMMAFAKQEQP